MKGPGRIVAEGTLGVGLQLPIQARSGAFAAPWEADAGVEELALVVQACDTAGFLYVGVCDHIAIPEAAVTAMGRDWFDTVATLGWLAALTSDVGLLSHVYVPLHRHPLAVAKAFATLDVLSGGRAILGAGAGHLRPEFDALGTPFPGRGTLLDEALEAIDAALVDEYPTLDGPTWRSQGMTVGPRCVREPRLPIWVGGSSPAALARAARLGDGWLPQATSRDAFPGQVAELMDLREATRPGESIDVGMFTERLHIGTDHSMVKGATVCGRGEELAAHLAWYRDNGATHVQVSFFARSASELSDQIEQFGEETIPLLG